MDDYILEKILSAEDGNSNLKKMEYKYYCLYGMKNTPIIIFCVSKYAHKWNKKGNEMKQSNLLDWNRKNLKTPASINDNHEKLLVLFLKFLENKNVHPN